MARLQTRTIAHAFCGCLSWGDRAPLSKISSIELCILNVMVESMGRLLATLLYEMTNDPGMKDMLSFLIARDIMHENQ
jgi:hypothetical protein